MRVAYSMNSRCRIGRTFSGRFSLTRGRTVRRRQHERKPRMLGDHYSDSDYLSQGWHLVEIDECRLFEYNTGNPGVEYVLKDGEGAQTKMSFALSGKGVKRLAHFAKACGLSHEDAMKFDPESEVHHKKYMVGKKVRVWVEKDGKYHKGTDWSS